jgi:hypothetical protein
MKYFVFTLLVCLSLGSRAQVCLNNFTYSTAVGFDLNWVYGCATGTSCSGGTSFLNLASCEPTTAMDPCAPAPSTCGSATNESDLWYWFYAQNTTVVISVMQNTSFVAAIQAFSEGADCATLSQIGCAVAGGPSSGVQLTLTGLTVNERYYYRVYGSANNASHRTGNFCFCGSSGMADIPLPVTLSLQADLDGSAALLNWTAVEGQNLEFFEVERSSDALTFGKVGTVDAEQSSFVASYEFQDRFCPNGTNYYRLKAVDVNGTVTYSNIAELRVQNNLTFEIAENPCKDVLHIQAQEPFEGHILNHHGADLLVQDMQVGENAVDVQALSTGIYFIQNAENGAVRKFMVMR